MTKYRLAITCEKINYNWIADFYTKEFAEMNYNQCRERYRREGYELADAGGDNIESGMCELWIKKTRRGQTIERNIEIFAVA